MNIFKFRLIDKDGGTLASALRTLPELEDQHARATRRHADLRAERDALYEAASLPADLDKIDADEQEAQRNVQRTLALLEAAKNRIARLQSEEDEKGKDQRRAELHKKAKAYVASIGKVQKLVKDLAAGVRESHELGLAVFNAMPTRTVAGAPISPISNLDQQIQFALSVHSDGLLGPLAGSELWTYRQRPQLVAVAEELMAHWLSGLPE